MTLLGRIAMHAAATPRAPAYIEGGRPFAYGGLLDAAGRVAAFFRAEGVREGDVVALRLTPEPGAGPRLIAALYGAAWIGARVLPLYTGELPPERDEELVRRFGALEPRIPARALARAHEPPPRADRPEAPYLYQFTSGTTGAPKVSLFTQGQLAARMAAAAASLACSARDRWTPSRPWPSGVALRFMLQAHWTGGALANAPFPADRGALAGLVRRGATMLSSSPAQLRHLLADKRAHAGTPRGLRVLYIAGALITARELEAVRREICPNTYVVYGASELGHIAVHYPDDPAGEDGRVGRPLPQVQVEVVDERHRPLPAGTPGSLRLRAPWLPAGYVDNPQATAERFREGWFYPGDVGRVTNEGWVQLLGRADDVINVGGVKIQPEVVEACLREHPEVADIALVGVPDPVTGEQPVAFVVLRQPIGLKALFRHCDARLDAGRRPAFFVASTDIPRNAAGKVDREALRARWEKVRTDSAAGRRPPE